MTIKNIRVYVLFLLVLSFSKTIAQETEHFWVTSSFSKMYSGRYKAHSKDLPKTFNLNDGDKQNYAPGGRGFNGAYYVLNNIKEDKRGIRKMEIVNGKLTDTLTIYAGGNNGVKKQKYEVNFTLFSKDIGYFTDVEHYKIGFIKVFNPMTMKVIDSCSVADGVKTKMQVLVGDKYVKSKIKTIGGKLLIRRGNYLYADVSFGTRTDYGQVIPPTEISSVFVAVIDMSLEKADVIKVLEGKEAQVIGLFNDHPLVNIDPKTNSIYFATVSNMKKEYGTDAGKFSRIFAIDTDNNIKSIVSYGELSCKKEGEFNSMFVYNDKIYTKIASKPVRYGSWGLSGQDYRKYIWQYCVVDVNTKAKKELAIPKDDFVAYQQPQLIDGAIYVISNTDNEGSNIYKITSNDDKVEKVSSATNVGWWLSSPNKISSIVRLKKTK